MLTNSETCYVTFFCCSDTKEQLKQMTKLMFLANKSYSFLIRYCLHHKCRDSWNYSQCVSSSVHRYYVDKKAFRHRCDDTGNRNSVRLNMCTFCICLISLLKSSH